MGCKGGKELEGEGKGRGQWDVKEAKGWRGREREEVSGM